MPIPLSVMDSREEIEARMDRARKLLNHPDIRLKANMQRGYMQLELRNVVAPSTLAVLERAG